MGFEMTRPWYLLLLPLGMLAVLLTDRRYARRGLKARVTRAARLATLLLLTLALSGVQVLGRSEQQAVWLLVDASDSAKPFRQQMDQAVQAALNDLPPQTQAGVIAFGREAMVETALSGQSAYLGQSVLVDGGDSDLNGAMQLAGALLPAGAAGRLVVLTDGRVEVPDLSGLAARGVAVDGRIFTGEEPPDVQVVSLAVPSSGYQGQTFSLTVTLNSNSETEATLILYANRQALSTRQVQIRKGENTFVFQDVAASPGTVAYQVQVSAQGDQVMQNDQAGAYMVVSGQPSLLLVEGKAEGADNLAAMLTAAGMAFERLPPAMLGQSPQSYTRYDAVLLCNVAAEQLTDAQVSALNGAVRDLGRGLCVFGGDNAYALGGYRDSDLEKLLPVTIDVKNKLDMPTLALMLVIDKSGSMAEGQYGVSRLDLAKEAAVKAAEMLTPRDSVGVIAFDDAAKWVVPLQNVHNPEAISQAIGTIRPDGGTAFYTALFNAYMALAASDARQRHVIFLTDGESGDGGYDAVVQAMRSEGITLTTVAVGGGANAVELKRLADLGGGRVYVTNEFDNIPAIFAKETYLASGSYVVNRAFTPALVEEGPLTDYGALPQLDGYLATTLKPLARLALASDRDEPVLAWWQYGAGRVLSWTSDTQGGWTQGYLDWDQCAAFFSGMAAFVLPQREQAGSLLTEGGELRYSAPVGGETVAYQAQVLSPSGESVVLPLTQVADGAYSAPWQPQEVGAYAISIVRDGQTVLEGGHLNSYSAEYDLPDDDQARALAAAIVRGGGRDLAEGDDLILPPQRQVRTRADLTDPLLIAALVLLVLDVALRRLAWEHLAEHWADKAPRRPAPKKKRPPEPGPPKPPVHGQTETTQKLVEAMKGRKKL